MYEHYSLIPIEARLSHVTFFGQWTVSSGAYYFPAEALQAITWLHYILFLLLQVKKYPTLKILFKSQNCVEDNDSWWTNRLNKK